VKHGRRRVAAFYLLTLTIYDDIERLPNDLVTLIHREQQNLLDLWENLNQDA
jgi:hypothetical protein